MVELSLVRMVLAPLPLFVDHNLNIFKSSVINVIVVILKFLSKKKLACSRSVPFVN